jgi:hypothetical protein
LSKLNHPSLPKFIGTLPSASDWAEIIQARSRHTMINLYVFIYRGRYRKVIMRPRTILSLVTMIQQCMRGDNIRHVGTNRNTLNPLNPPRSKQCKSNRIVLQMRCCLAGTDCCWRYPGLHTSGANTSSTAPMITVVLSDHSATPLCPCIIVFCRSSRVHTGVACPLGDAYLSSLVLPSLPREVA